MGIDIDGSFIFPAATSIFVYREASPGDKDVCACADAAGVKESGLHVWLYVHEDEYGESYRWFRQAEVKAGVHKQQAVLSEHLIYQRFRPGCSNGPPMLRCTHGQGTTPDSVEEFSEVWDLFLLEYVWNRCKPAKICAKRLRCQQCGLHQQLKHFARAHDGTEPKIDMSRRRDDLGGDFEEFCTVWCNFCKDQFFPCRRCKYPFPKETYTPSMRQHRFERGATCTSCEAARHLCCEVCLKEIDEEKCRCNQCGKLKGKTEYSASMWHHKASTDRTIICLQCEAKNIEGAKHPCNKCGQWKLQTEYSASMWNHRANTDQMIICLECEAQTPTFRCDICNISKPVGAFSASALSHSKTQNTRCYDCSNPPCMFRPKCTTCTKCRGTTCKDTNCTKDIKTVPPRTFTSIG